MKLITRRSNSGHEVAWEPEHTELAIQALTEVDGTDVSSAAEPTVGQPIDLGEDHELAREVRQRYGELVEKHSGSTS